MPYVRSPTHNNYRLYNLIYYIVLAVRRGHAIRKVQEDGLELSSLLPLYTLTRVFSRAELTISLAFVKISQR